MLSNPWNSTIPNEAYSSVLHVYDDGTGSILVQTASETLMNGIAIELGEALYQLRAALDACIYEAAVRHTGKNPPPNEGALQFPICINNGKFKEAARQIAPLPDELKAFIEAVQPYQTIKEFEDLEILSLNKTLAVLSEWARIDRHRRLHVIGVLPAAFSPNSSFRPACILNPSTSLPAAYSRTKAQSPPSRLEDLEEVST